MAPGEVMAGVAAEREGRLWILVYPLRALFILINQLKK